MAWIGGLAFFALWGALLGWKYAPYHTAHVAAARRPMMAQLWSFAAALLGAFLSHLLMRWLLASIFNSPIFDSESFYLASFIVTIAVFCAVFLRLILWHQEQMASPEGQQKLRQIVEEAEREVEAEARNSKKG